VHAHFGRDALTPPINLTQIKFASLSAADVSSMAEDTLDIPAVPRRPTRSPSVSGPLRLQPHGGVSGTGGFVSSELEGYHSKTVTSLFKTVFLTTDGATCCYNSCGAGGCHITR
jgi:hypothetical protein